MLVRAADVEGERSVALAPIESVRSTWWPIALAWVVLRHPGWSIASQRESADVLSVYGPGRSGYILEVRS
jgi:hypothetical protein